MSEQSFDLEQIRVQTVKATTYFRRILEDARKGIICGRQDDVVIVIAKGRTAEIVESALQAAPIGRTTDPPVQFHKIPAEWPPTVEKKDG